MANNPGKSQNTNRGFANMDAGKQREIAAQGGRAAHASGNAHEFNSAEASAAGRKGGAASHRNKAQAAGNNSGTRGGSSAQHAHAGQQSHKNK